MSLKRTLLVYFALIAFIGVIDARSRMPEWITNSLSDPQYYQGVGYADKVRRSTAHIEQAERAALRSLASEISVEIQASTLLIQYDNDNTIKEDFTSVIEARVQSELEGCEKVATYETRKGYWVYYRLSKQKYAQQQAEKREKATNIAFSYFQAGEQAEKINDIRTSIMQYIKTLDALKSYFNEHIYVLQNGQQINLIAESYNRLSALLNTTTMSLSIAPQFTVKMGKQFSADEIYVSVRHNGAAVVNCPVLITYSEQVQKMHGTSDEQGRVGANFKVKSNNRQETLTFNIDYEHILLEATSDYAIRKWLRQISVHEKTVAFAIEKPTIYIDDHETNLGYSVADAPLKRALTSLFENASYCVTDTAQNADYIIVVDATTRAQSQTNGVFTAILNAKLTLKNAENGQILSSQTIDNVSGKQLSYAQAGFKAYETAVSTIEMRCFNELERTIRLQ